MKKLPTAADKRAEKIVDQLEEWFGYSHYRKELSSWDHDEARRLIASLIPQTAAEAEEELDAILEKVAGIDSLPKPNPNSPYNRLRRAVHATPEMSIKCVIEAAIEKLEVNHGPQENHEETA